METKEIIINEVGMKVHGYMGSEILAVLIEALCHAWSKESGLVDIVNAGKKVVDALFAAEDDYKMNVIYEAITGDGKDE